MELCDLSNELGIAIANLAGSDKSLEKEVTTGIEHGFDLVRRRDESAHASYIVRHPDNKIKSQNDAHEA